MKDLRALFEEQIKDLYSSETQIIKTLPEMIDAAHDDDLRSALEDHLKETEEQKDRLEQLSKDQGFKPSGHKCKGMEGILEEGDELVGEAAEDDNVRDAAIIAAAQKVEHYEMAGYGTARAYARMLGLDDVATTLQRTLDEEQDADERLTRIAESHVNRSALD